MQKPFDENKICSCGKTHKTFIPNCIVKKDAINDIVTEIQKFNAKRPFIVADVNTYFAAGEKVEKSLCESGITAKKYIYKNTHLEPDETTVGSLFLNYDADSDIIIGIGSGVINDICKILAHHTKNPYIIVATAPSMDGYASPLSSMVCGGLKVSVPSKCAEVIIGDLDILKTAPIHMLKSGIGDILAKYVSICEWRISNLVTGEYYCEEIAQLVRDSLKKCVDNADRILKRDDAAIINVMEGLVLSGLAMSYAGISRPASGAEHSFSHILDMRTLEFGSPADLHGIQCAIGTMLCVKIYNYIKNITPDKDKALKHAQNFDLPKWFEELKSFLGKAADSMIALEKKEDKYNVKNHEARLAVLIERWDDVVNIIEKEIPETDEFEKLLDLIASPKTPDEMGIEKEVTITALKAATDIRDKYILPKLLWDIGVIDEICEEINNK